MDCDLFMGSELLAHSVYIGFSCIVVGDDYGWMTAAAEYRQ